MADELQKHLDHGRYGAPNLKPDEQRQYLGTFRERCLLSMTVRQMEQPPLKKILDQHLTEFAGHSILLNGSMPESLQNEYIQLASQHHFPFTIVTTEDTCTEDAIGLLIIATEAVDVPVIDIEQQFPTQTETQKVNSAEPKKHFWDKLFH